MNTTNRQRSPARVRAPARTPWPAAPPHRHDAAELEQLKHMLLAPWLAGAPSTRQHGILRQAANEAAALAWITPFPLLFLPALVEEKLHSARQHTERQGRIRRESRRMLTEVA